ncbi:MAG: hypothetical protein ABJA76_00580 [Mucilaginibacter sp.]
MSLTVAVQYIAEPYEGCMCAKCLTELQEEYRAMLEVTVRP